LVKAVTERAGRKAVLVAPASGMQIASAIAESHRDLISDIVVLDASHHPDVPLGIRAHFISSGLSQFLAMAVLPQVLRNICIELIEAPGPDTPEADNGGAPLTYADRQLSTQEQPT
jgi:hypothetical protein